MILVIDIGNTNVVFGVFTEGGELINYWRKGSMVANSADEVGLFIKQLLLYEGIEVQDIQDIIIASVVPNTLYSITHMVQKYFGLEPFILTSDAKINFTIDYENPKQLGADRIANVVGAIEKYEPPFIIVDMGTATTFCAVSKDCRYLGGSIVPGITIAMDALYARAAQLTRIELERAERYISTNTQDSMQSGAYFGYIGQIEKIIVGMKEEMGEDATVIATGGLSTLVENDLKKFDVVDKLITLEGLYHIFRLNHEE